MVIMEDSLPGIKRFLKVAGLEETTQLYVTRFVVAFIMHLGRMSAAAASSSVRIDPRHRAQVMRFLLRDRRIQDLSVLPQLVDFLLSFEHRRSGDWLLIIDQTYCTQQGVKTENTFSHGQKVKSGKDRRRRKKTPRRRCHCFVMGLLITPSGLRVPLYLPYYTREYLKIENEKRAKKNLPPLPYKKQTELAAELIRTAPIPKKAKAVVLGDNAFDADVFQEACEEKGYSWIVPMNRERVLEQEKSKKPKPKVTSLASDLREEQFATVKLTPGKGDHVAQRRESACRIGRKRKTRTFHVHLKRLTVQSVGEVQVVFSTMITPKAGKPVEIQKVLMTNDLTLSAAEIVELYDLRWQIELFFKELKSTLGFHHYRFRKFNKVERWVTLCLITFLYLEWFRAEQLAKRDLSPEKRQWWSRQRAHGLCTVIRQETEERELVRLASYTKTKGGIRKLKKILRDARPLEQRNAA
jgi:SRSO17 transposase